MRRQLQKANQPFSFTPENTKHLEQVKRHYPEGRERSALMEALYTVQRQQGWVSQESVEKVSEFLGVAAIHVYEVASFYTMFNLDPPGKHHLQVCTTTPCWLRGSDGVLSACQKASKKHGKEVFSVTEVECLGGCVNAPILQINNDYYEDLDEEATNALLEDLASGKNRPRGSVIGRQGSAPEGGPQVLQKKAEKEGGAS